MSRSCVAVSRGVDTGCPTPVLTWVSWVLEVLTSSMCTAYHTSRDQYMVFLLLMRIHVGLAMCLAGLSIKIGLGTFDSGSNSSFIVIDHFLGSPSTSTAANDSRSLDLKVGALLLPSSLLLCPSSLQQSRCLNTRRQSSRSGKHVAQNATVSRSARCSHFHSLLFHNPWWNTRLCPWTMKNEGTNADHGVRIDRWTEGKRTWGHDVIKNWRVPAHAWTIFSRDREDIVIVLTIDINEYSRYTDMHRRLNALLCSCGALSRKW